LNQYVSDEADPFSEAWDEMHDAEIACEQMKYRVFNKKANEMFGAVE